MTIEVLPPEYREANWVYDEWGPFSRLGRQTRCTPATAQAIWQLMRHGVSLTVACRSLQPPLAEENAMRWLARGRQELRRRDDGEEADPYEERFVLFVEGTTRARSEAEVFANLTVRRAMQDPDAAVALRAATWYLERANPSLYGRRRAMGADADTDTEDEPEAALADTARQRIMTKLEAIASRTEAAEAAEAVEARPAV
jgi:hypothetical protein